MNPTCKDAAAHIQEEQYEVGHPRPLDHASLYSYMLYSRIVTKSLSEATKCRPRCLSSG